MVLCKQFLISPVAMEGNLTTIMAGLNCGTPSVLAWRILKGCASSFLSCDDEITCIGMRQLYYPTGRVLDNMYAITR